MRAGNGSRPAPAGVDAIRPELSADLRQAYPESRSLDDDVLWIAKVRIGNQRFTSRNDGEGYEDHTGQVFALYSGARTYMSLHPKYEPTSELPVYWLVWIDLNGDGDFDRYDVVFALQAGNYIP